MNKLACQYFVMLIVTCACAQTPANLPTPRPRPPWSATITVVDEAGRPIPGADVEVSYYLAPPPGKTEAEGRIHGPTDTNGIFSATRPDTGSTTLGFRVSKPGYYASSIGRTLYQSGQFDEKTVSASRTIVLTITLKKIGRPTPMYAKWVNLGMPVFDKPVGFDLIKGDWAAPYGAGLNADFIFTAHREKHSEFDVDYRLTVTFPNQGDGIQEFTVPELERSSDLLSPQEAPTSGYQSQWVQTTIRKPGQPIQTNRDEKRNYLFRVRTVLDESGGVKSANYGKIYGDFLQFRYYLNPTPNDREIEFDPKRNLLSGLKSFERVDAP